MSLINIDNLTFCYERSSDYIFKDISFRIDTDWKLGFVGRNGRGKTTFLKLLMGKYEYLGSISHSVEFDYFPFEIEDKSKNTLDIITSAVAADFELWELCRELNLLEVDKDCLYRPFNTLSNGEQTKVLLAALFLKENNFLLIDEPTNHLDLKARQTVSNYLNHKKSFILVSHDRSFLDNCVSHILSINRTDIDVQKCNFSGWLLNKERQDAFEKAQNERLEKDIDRLKSSAKRSAEWADKGYRESTGDPEARQIGFKEFHRKKAEKIDSMAKALIKRQNKEIEEKSGLLKNLETAWPLKISPLKHYSECLADIKNLSVLYDGRAVFSGLNLTLNQGERICLRGKNGCGKTSLLKLILGKEINYSGQLRLASNLKISYVSQDISELKGSLKEFALNHGLDETLFKSILAKLDFSKTLLENDIQAYSMGQKKKVLIAKSLSESAHLYIWDEPLNYVDIISRLQIEEAVKNYSPTLLFVEHDKFFADNIATEVVEL